MKKDIGPMIKILNDKLKATADASLKENALTFSQSMVMEFVHSQGGKATQKNVEERMAVAHPTVVGIVSRLEKNGFLTCHTDEFDRRNKIVCETQKALDLYEIMQNERQKTERKLTKGFSERELENLRQMLEALLKNIE